MSRTDQNRFRSVSERSVRRGFTLVELLLVIVIIAILAAMSLTIQRAAVQSTRRERTVTTIRKIDAALTAAYEKYQYRKPDISEYLNIAEQSDFSGFENEIARKRECYRRLLLIISGHWALWLEKDFLTDQNTIDASTDVQIAPYVFRTLLLRELLLSDFPDSLSEVKYEPLLSTSAVHRIYQSYAGALQDAMDDKDSDGDVSADLLYLIVMNTSPETRGTFLERETRDTNGNGIPEFIDGWGNPIRFIRWAPALLSSNRQPTFSDAIKIQHYLLLKQEADADPDWNPSGSTADYLSDDFYSVSISGYPESDYDFYTNFETYYPGLLDFSADPFDPMQSLNGWLLTPLIYSAGPDKEYGMAMTENFYRYDSLVDLSLGMERSPFMDSLGKGIGLGFTEADDNITNHNLE